MSGTLSINLDTFNFIQKNIGEKKVTINSGIFAHCWGQFEREDEEIMDYKKDIFIIENENGITLEDIINVFEKMQEQFKVVEKCCYYSSFFNIGITKKDDIYRILWVSTPR